MLVCIAINDLNQGPHLSRKYTLELPVLAVNPGSAARVCSDLTRLKTLRVSKVFCTDHVIQKL